MADSEVLNYFKNKKLLFTHWNCEDKQDYSFQNWYYPFKRFFGEIITFSPKKNYFNFGKEEMNQKFLELVEKEKPDYIFFLLIYDEFDPLIFLEIKKISPKTKLMVFLSDDSWRYEDFGRYYSLFMDYILTAYHKSVSWHKKDGAENVWFSIGVNTENFKPLNLEKKYDVVFIGGAGQERAEYMRFLVQQGIKVDIFGHGWEKYPEFKDFYHFPLSSEEWVKVVNQSKINLSFSMGGSNKLQLKGRPFEVSACKSFILVGYNEDYRDFFSKNELVMFKDKKDLLEKIKYYLKNEKEREKIADSAYKKITKKFSLMQELSIILKEIMNYEKAGKRKELPSLSKRIIYLSKNDLNLTKEKLAGKIKKFSFICFNTGCKIHPLRNLIQAHSLEKSKKEISCCDYYVNSKNLGNYLLFKANFAFNNLPKKEFDRLLDASQIMATKNFFIKNLGKFKKFFKQQEFSLISNKNTAFISIPLVEIKNLKSIDYKTMKTAFQFKFLDRLYSLRHQMKIFPYMINLLLLGLRKKFLLKAIKDSLLDRNSLAKFIKGF